MVVGKRHRAEAEGFGTSPRRDKDDDSGGEPSAESPEEPDDSGGVAEPEAPEPDAEDNAGGDLDADSDEESPKAAQAGAEN